MTILFGLTPICLLGILGTGVSLKYEVDEARTMLEVNENSNKQQKIESQLLVDKHEKELKTIMALWITGFICFPISATALIIFRKRMIK